MRAISPGGFRGLSQAPSLRAAPRTATHLMSPRPPCAHGHRRPACGSASSVDRSPPAAPVRARRTPRPGCRADLVRQCHGQIRRHARLAGGQSAQPECGLVEQRRKGHGCEVAALTAETRARGPHPEDAGGVEAEPRAQSRGFSTPQTKQVVDTGRGIRAAPAGAAPRRGKASAQRERIPATPGGRRPHRRRGTPSLRHRAWPPGPAGHREVRVADSARRPGAVRGARPAHRGGPARFPHARRRADPERRDRVSAWGGPRCPGSREEEPRWSA